MIHYLGLGLTMGLSAGISPGPLLALVITATLRSGLGGGLRVALAPLLTDAPIIALSVLFAGLLPRVVLCWVGVAGGLVVIWMGVEILRSARDARLPGAQGPVAEPGRELWRGVAVNALNPHPYLFWATIGGPALIQGWHVSGWHALAFLAPFYGLLVGSKMALAWAVSRRAGGLSATWYRRLLTGCSLLLLGLGAWVIYQSWNG
jgi:threonine/homoserine/homoserine lactone efflux protein